MNSYAEEVVDYLTKLPGQTQFLEGQYSAYQMIREIRRETNVGKYFVQLAREVELLSV